MWKPLAWALPKDVASVEPGVSGRRRTGRWSRGLTTQSSGDVVVVAHQRVFVVAAVEAGGIGVRVEVSRPTRYVLLAPS